MAAKSKNVFRDNLTLIGSILPIMVLLGSGAIWILNLSNSVTDSERQITSLTETIKDAREVLEIENGESIFNRRLGDLEWHIYEHLEDRLAELDQTLLVLNAAIQTEIDRMDGTLYYLYTMPAPDGAQSSIGDIYRSLVKIETEIENILNSHVWYNAYIERLDAQLLESMGIRIQVPSDSYTGGYNYGR